jgi:hypothetical protein
VQLGSSSWARYDALMAQAQGIAAQEVLPAIQALEQLCARKQRQCQQYSRQLAVQMVELVEQTTLKLERQLEVWYAVISSAEQDLSYWTALNEATKTKVRTLPFA